MIFNENDDMVLAATGELFYDLPEVANAEGPGGKVVVIPPFVAAPDDPGKWLGSPPWVSMSMRSHPPTFLS